MRTWSNALAALALVLLGACAAMDSSSGSTGPTTNGSRAADFALRDLDGNMVRLSDYKGKVVLVNFWATWCTSCAAEQPQLEKLWNSYRERGFVVLAVSMDGPETIAEVAPMVRSRNLTFPVLLDTETRVTGSMNPRRAAPFTLVIGRDGAVAWQKASYANGDAAEVEGLVQRLL
jgi:peroxiredoxin